MVYILETDYHRNSYNRTLFLLSILLSFKKEIVMQTIHAIHYLV